MKLHVTRYTLHVTAILLAIGFGVLAAPEAYADHGGIHILPTPGETCADATCRKQICPQSPVARSCVAGQCVVEGGNPATENVPCNFTLDDLVLAGINMSKFIFGIVGSLMLMFIAYGGYSFLTSMGNPEAIQKARGILTAAFIGFILIVAAAILVQFVAGLIGVKYASTGVHKIPGVCSEEQRCPEGFTKKDPPPDDFCPPRQIYCELRPE